MRNVNSLPNGRIIIACLNCGHRHDLAKYGWTRSVCVGCRQVILNPVNQEPVTEIPTKKTNLMLSNADRNFIGTVATLQGVSKSKALSIILEYSRQEYRAAGHAIIEEVVEEVVEPVEPVVSRSKKSKKVEK